MSTSSTHDVHPVPADELRRFGDMGREMSGLTVLFHARIAEQMGVSATDYKCLDIAIRSKDRQLTAGQIAKLSGLSTGAVTGVIDRLEKRGLVRRVRDPLDRRKVLVEVTLGDESKFDHLFAHLATGLHDLLIKFNPQERQIIERFQREMIDTFRRVAFEAGENG